MDETSTPAAEAHHTVVVTDDTFKTEVQDFKGTVLVDFWAEWCGPCHVMAPRVEELAASYAKDDKVKIVKLNVDENEKVAFEQRVMSLPTFKLFKDGEVIDELIGSRPVEDLVELLKRNLAPAA